MVSMRAMGVAAICAAICAALAACAEVGPDYKVPPQALVNAPAANGAFVSGATVATNDPLPDHWWRLYEDPVLNGLIEKALASNVDLRAAQANLERSDALLASARTAREPDIAADASTNYTQQSAQAVLSHVQPPRHETYNMGIAISYDLDLFGGIRRGIEAASADREAVVAARDLVRVNVAAQTARAYSDLCNAGNQLDILQQQIAVQQRRLALTREMIAHGRAPSFTQDRDQSAIESSRAQLAPLQARKLNAAFRLATLMGKPPEQYDPSLLACHTPLALTTLIPSGDGRAMLSRRPDVRAAERQLAAATAQIGVQTAALYPDIKIGASIGSTGGAASFFTPLTNRFAVGPMVSWDLHRDAIRDRIEAARAGSRVSLAHFDSTVLTALRETETSLDNYAAALDRLQRLESARDAARSVNDRTDQLWRGGKVGGLEALDAQRTWLAAENAVAAAQADVNNNQISTFLALGGGWQ
ncbi:efflux transporter outer membrane subunit [Paraburkholderia tagetis]|uniref:TolC family protein n=1 Tax=Paraburkholderia tagetis TaxID=2913261 RepID=A0A9X1RP55_9BURK|nr:TolC family protein [Paraburkholderia tagetis]MCG5074715.1 TolC family protein [Paraburkholderia tagetis]